MLPLKSKHFLAAVLVALSSLIAPPALAAPKDKEALELASQAIMVEYLGTQFEQAATTLRKALELCQQQQGNCSPKVLAQLHRDLGVVLITGLGKMDDGKLQFAQALKHDPRIQLDADLTTDEVKQAFEEVKATQGAPVLGGAPGGEEPPGAVIPGTGGPAPEGDLVHQPPTEQAVLTPVPLYVDVPPDMAGPGLKLKVRYKTFGAERWKTIEMSRHGTGYAALIPCEDISDVTGELQYYIQATEGPDIVGFSGSRRVPHRVMIKRMLSGEPPRLPGQPPPAQCKDEGGLPDCFDDEDCGTGAICTDGKCVDSGEAPKAGPAKVNWVSGTFQVDFLRFPGEIGVCSGSDTYKCFYSDGTQYFGIPMLEQGNQVNAGFGMATMRVLLGYDRVITGGLTLGLRVGYAFGGGPTAAEPDAKDFFPWHLEARGAYWLLSDSFRREGFRPYLLLSGGMSQVDGKVVVTVVNDPDVEQPVEAEIPGESRLLEAWTKKGLAFAALGGGLMYAMNPDTGIFVEARIGQLFGASGMFATAGGGVAFGM